MQSVAKSFFAVSVALIVGAFQAAYADSEDRYNRISQIMSRAEVEAELFGTWMEGETTPKSQIWSECIEPDGLSRYQINGIERVGRLNVDDEGQACFSYEVDDFTRESCFKVSRSQNGYTFWGGSEGIFVTNTVRRNIKHCPPATAPIS
jgi:hypothetical protein